MKQDDDVILSCNVSTSIKLSSLDTICLNLIQFARGCACVFNAACWKSSGFSMNASFFSGSEKQQRWYSCMVCEERNDTTRIGVRSLVVDFLAYNVKRLEREEKNIIGFKSFVMDITGSLVFYALPT